VRAAGLDHGWRSRTYQRLMAAKGQEAQVRASTYFRFPQSLLASWAKLRLARAGQSLSCRLPLNYEVHHGPVTRSESALRISGGASSEKLKHFGGHTPFGRPGMPAELAGIYVQLADERGSFATGQIYGSSGGAVQP
jgi:NAD(P)-dependent dehydrogenase (short-subunit alcohol dehydrogenase family)